MITKEELLNALIVKGAITKYVTVEKLLENPALWGMKSKTLGVGLLRLRRHGLVKYKKFGKAYGYKLTRKGLKRLIYFYDKRKTQREIQEFRRMINKSYNELLFVRMLEEKEEKEKRDLIELIKLLLGKEDD